jgi:hypothetical protein
MRKTGTEIEAIKKKYNVNDIYSWSKYNSIKTNLYTYFLKYVLKKDEDKSDNIYSDAGNLVHGLLEDYYCGKLKKEELENLYDEQMYIFEISGKKFDRTDEDKNIQISQKYNYCNKHFFKNFIPITGENIKTEEFLLIKIDDLLFQGYSDFEHNEIRNGKNKIIITDFKTSTIYTGKKIEKERGQLLLYALAKIQQGYDINDIIIRWLFTKYVSVTVPNKDGTRIRNISRNEIGSCLCASIKTQLKNVIKYTKKEIDEFIENMIKNKNLELMPNFIKNNITQIEYAKNESIKKTFINKIKKLLSTCRKYNDSDIETIIDELILTNDIQCVPKKVRDMFIINDCYVEIPFNKKDLDNLKIEIKETITNIIEKENEYKNQKCGIKDDSMFFEEIKYEDSYFFSVLSGYSANLHKPYKAYLDKLESDKNNFNNKKDEEDLSWMDELFE